MTSGGREPQSRARMRVARVGRATLILTLTLTLKLPLKLPLPLALALTPTLTLTLPRRGQQALPLYGQLPSRLIARADRRRAHRGNAAPPAQGVLPVAGGMLREAGYISPTSRLYLAYISRAGGVLREAG